MKIGIGFKIGSVVLALLVLVGAAAFINARNARQVEQLIRDVQDVYVPAYGNLARAHIRLVEEGLFVRRLLFANVTAPDDKEGLAKLRSSVLEKSQAARQELTEARRLIGNAASGAFDDKLALARLDTRVEYLMTRHGEYDAVFAEIEGANQRHDDAAVEQLLNELDRLRNLLYDEAEKTRAGMRIILEAAGDRSIAAQDGSVKIGLGLLALALALGAVTGIIVIRNMVRPLKRLLQGTRLVQAGNLEAEVPVTTRDEVGQLTEGFNSMVRDLRAKSRIRETFGRYLDPRIVEGLIDRPDLLGGTGDRREMTIFFCDMQGFTTISEGMTPPAMVRVINRYLGLMSEPIRRNQGIIDKYIGDGIMAFWGPPFSTGSDHARLACVAGIEQLAALPVFRAELPELTGLRRGGPAIDMRIGIATGDAIVGNIGSDLTMNYTVMGDTVNFASRLEGANKAYGTRLLVSARTAALAAEVITCREIDLLRVEGKLEPERVFDVLGRRGEVPEAVTKMAAHFADGLAAYRARDWWTAQTSFEAALAAQPEDGPTRVFLERLKSLDPDAIPVDWDGVWVLHQK